MSESEIEEIKKDLKTIKNALLGTFDEEGIIHKVRWHDKVIRQHMSNNLDRWNWAYKIAITIILGYIAAQMGLK